MQSEHSLASLDAKLDELLAITQSTEGIDLENITAMFQAILLAVNAPVLPPVQTLPFLYLQNLL